MYEKYLHVFMFTYMHMLYRIAIRLEGDFVSVHHRRSLGEELEDMLDFVRESISPPKIGPKPFSKRAESGL